MINNQQDLITPKDQVEDILPPDLLYTILGPTASGKTALAVSLARSIDGEIISIDSRQVYRGMDIGTGKDIEEYGNIPYHLIDIVTPGERYDISQFQNDFDRAYHEIQNREKQPIAVGGTGFYMHGLFVSQPYIHVEINPDLRTRLLSLDKVQLVTLLEKYPIPNDFKIDRSSHKRLIRAIEILEALKNGYKIEKPTVGPYNPLIFGINPPLEQRRANISKRLKQRMEDGLIDEVKNLLSTGLTHEDLQYYGLEYKYVSLHLLGELSQQDFFTKLETEIHRYAKRQMTFFRKMEKDGLNIHWLKGETTDQRLNEILLKLKKE